MTLVMVLQCSPLQSIPKAILFFLVCLFKIYLQYLMGSVLSELDLGVESWFCGASPTVYSQDCHSAILAAYLFCSQ